MRLVSLISVGLGNVGTKEFLKDLYLIVGEKTYRYARPKDHSLSSLRSAASNTFTAILIIQHMGLSSDDEHIVRNTISEFHREGKKVAVITFVNDTEAKMNKSGDINVKYVVPEVTSRPNQGVGGFGMKMNSETFDKLKGFINRELGAVTPAGHLVPFIQGHSKRSGKPAKKILIYSDNNDANISSYLSVVVEEMSMEQHSFETGKWEEIKQRNHSEYDYVIVNVHDRKHGTTMMNIPEEKLILLNWFDTIESDSVPEFGASLPSVTLPIFKGTDMTQYAYNTCTLLQMLWVMDNKRYYSAKSIKQEVKIHVNGVGSVVKHLDAIIRDLQTLFDRFTGVRSVRFVKGNAVSGVPSLLLMNADNENSVNDQLPSSATRNDHLIVVPLMDDPVYRAGRDSDSFCAIMSLKSKDHQGLNTNFDDKHTRFQLLSLFNQLYKMLTW